MAEARIEGELTFEEIAAITEAAQRSVDCRPPIPLPDETDLSPVEKATVVINGMVYYII